MPDIDTATAGERDAVPALQGRGFAIVRDREERGRLTGLRQSNEVPGLAGKVDEIAASVTVGEGSPSAKGHRRRRVTVGEGSALARFRPIRSD